MRFRYKQEDLEKSDEWMLYRVLTERMSDCTNVYSSLYKRLSQLREKYGKMVE